jgi:23S rRNA pseudouridine2605 synthase
MEERLQKILARAGIGSRRACEEIIVKGRVTVNGKVALIGMKADPVRDRILVNGRPINLETSSIYIALNKPRNVLSTVESDDPRTTVRDLVPVSERIYPVGRLDAESEGLILLTNDGDLTNRLTHPRYGHEKEYRVLVARRPDEEQLAIWRRGVVLPDGYQTGPARVTLDSLFGKGAWLRVILREGRKRQIRETASIIGLPVVRIIRIRIGSLLLGNLKSRQWRYLTPDEVKALKGTAEPASKSRSKKKAGTSMRSNTNKKKKPRSP